MCIIIDVNVASEFSSGSDDASPILKRIAKRRLRVVAGGDLKKEWIKTKLRKLYIEWQRAGVLTEYSDDAVRVGIESIDANLLCSNDRHIIGLAIASGSRLLFSRDRDLHSDFKNREILKGGKIYSSAAHSDLLDEHVCACG